MTQGVNCRMGGWMLGAGQSCHAHASPAIIERQNRKGRGHAGGEALKACSRTKISRIKKLAVLREHGTTSRCKPLATLL